MFHSLGEIIKKTVKKAGIGNQVETALVLEDFSAVLTTIMGEKIGKSVKPMYIRNKTLTIACLSSVIAQEIKFKEQKIIKTLNQKYSKEVVEKLIYMV